MKYFDRKKTRYKEAKCRIKLQNRNLTNKMKTYIISL